jgi:hypothetical protein
MIHVGASMLIGATCPLKWLLILKYFQSILEIFHLKVENIQIWLNKILQYIIM